MNSLKMNNQMGMLESFYKRRHRIRQELLKLVSSHWFFYQGEKYVCPVCEEHLEFFNPMGLDLFVELEKHDYIHPLSMSETLNIANYSCPSCGAADRERLFALYYKKKFAKLKDKVELLEFGPTEVMDSFFSKYRLVEHKTADLSRRGVDFRLDITDMTTIKDGEFDSVLCSHVLEHVVDDVKALKELYRILKPGGFGLVMVPIWLELEQDLERKSLKSDADRWHFHGQYDHVRSYSKSGFVSKLKEVGFEVKQRGSKYFGEKVFDVSGITRKSVLYEIRKGKNS